MPHRSPLQLAAAVALMFILVLFAQAMLDLPYRPRLATPTANYRAVAALAMLTPVLVLLVARMIPRKWARPAGYVAAGLLALPCLLISSCAMLEAPKSAEADGSYELLGEARLERVAYRLYRTNCGATCAYGLELREEWDLPFGGKLVTPRWSLYRASEGAVKVEESAVLVVNGRDVLGRVAR